MDLFFSVGVSTSDLKTGSPTVSISAGGVATFSIAQVGNIVSGDKLIYDTGETYLTTKISTTQWNVQLVSPVTDKTVTSIKRTFNSLMDISGIPTSSGLYPLLSSSSDLVTNTYKVYIMCCNDGMDELFTGFLSSSWVTNATYHFIVMTPIDTTLHCNQTNRTNYIEGNTQGYHTHTGLYNNTFEFQAAYTVVDGLSMESGGFNRFYGIGFGNNCEIKNCVLFDHISAVVYAVSGLGSGTKIHDCLIAFINNAGWAGSGLFVSLYGLTMEIYNCTCYMDASVDSWIFYDQFLTNVKVRNCNLYCQDGRVQRGSDRHADTDYNSTNNSAYYRGSSGSHGIKDLTLGNFDFNNTTPGTFDGRIGASSSCINVGVGQTVDASVPSPDIAGIARTGNDCDTGFNEYVLSFLGIGNILSSPILKSNIVKGAQK